MNASLKAGRFFVFFRLPKKLVALYGPIVVTYDAEVVTYGVPTRGNPTSSPDRYPHFESPQLRQVMQPSIITTAAVEHLAHSCAPSGK